MTESTDIPLRLKTALLCHAITDALGGPLEFGPRILDAAQHVTTMRPNNTFSLPAGHFTDDTSMALCLATSLLESRGVTDSISQARAYIRWWREGWMSSVPGKCFDIGIQTINTLTEWEEALSGISTLPSSSSTSSVPADQTDTTSDLTNPPHIEEKEIESKVLREISSSFSADHQCGNGSLMRVLPCALVSTSESQAERLAEESSVLTHPHPRCVDACVIFTRLVYRALRGGSKADLFDTFRDYIVRLSKPTPKNPPNASQTSSATVNSGALSTVREPGTPAQDQTFQDRFALYTTIASFAAKPLSQISSSGYVVNTLEAVLWAFFTTDTYRDGAVRAVNLGDDADTVGAIYGGLAGAFYGGRSGEESIVPAEWLRELKQANVVRGVAERIAWKFHESS